MRATAAASATMALLLIGCREVPTSPPSLSNGRVATDRLTGSTPNYNLEVLLRPAGEGDGFGHVKFRQPGNDDALIVYLDVWVRDLTPGTAYVLQRAVDSNLNGACSGTAWVNLGNQGNGVATPITTDDRGTARGEFFRTLATPGTTFEIQFRIVRNDSRTVPVLISDCYQFTVK